MQNIQVILSIATTVIALIASTITFILKFINSERAKSAAVVTTKISSALLGYIEEAEKFVTLSGTEKLSYVVEKVKSFTQEHGIEFSDELATSTIKQIEELVALTKKVNTTTQTKN